MERKLDGLSVIRKMDLDLNFLNNWQNLQDICIHVCKNIYNIFTQTVQMNFICVCSFLEKHILFWIKNCTR